MLLPPQDVVAARARQALAEQVREAVREEVARVLDLDDIAMRLARDAGAGLDMATLRAILRDRRQANPPEAWGGITDTEVRSRADIRAVRPAVSAALRQAGGP